MSNPAEPITWINRMQAVGALDAIAVDSPLSFTDPAHLAESLGAVITSFAFTLLDDTDEAGMRGTLGLGSAATHAETDFEGAGAVAALAATLGTAATHAETDFEGAGAVAALAATLGTAATLDAGDVDGDVLKIVQQAAIPNAAGTYTLGGDTIDGIAWSGNIATLEAKVNLILAALRANGLIAT